MGAAATTFVYMKRGQEQHDAPPAQQDGGGRAAGASSSAFDRLAGSYDERIGSEERVMLYGLMRW